MSPQPTKTVSVQIKLDLRRPGTFNYPKYHQRRCHDLTSARINGVLTKCLPLSATWASSRSVWKGAAGGFLHHCLGLSHCTCHRYDAITLNNRMAEMLGKFSHLLMSVTVWSLGKESVDSMAKYLFQTHHPKPTHTNTILNTDTDWLEKHLFKSSKSQWQKADKLNPSLIIFMCWSVAVTVADFASQQWHCVPLTGLGVEAPQP